MRDDGRFSMHVACLRGEGYIWACPKLHDPLNSSGRMDQPRIGQLTWFHWTEKELRSLENHSSHVRGWSTITKNEYLWMEFFTRSQILKGMVKDGNFTRSVKQWGQKLIYKALKIACQMNKWTNEEMAEWTNRWMNEQTNERTDK